MCTQFDRFWIQKRARVEAKVQRQSGSRLLLPLVTLFLAVRPSGDKEVHIMPLSNKECSYYVG